MEDKTVKELKEMCKQYKIKCSGNKQEIYDRLMEHINSVPLKKTTSRYYAGLTSSEKRVRKKAFEERSKENWNDSKTYRSFKTDFRDGKRIKTRKSKYTAAFDRLYPEADSLEEKSKATGVPVQILKKVYGRGAAAWRTGHRPGATVQQWALARVDSFLMKGCTYYKTDVDLVKEAEKYKKAREHWNSVDKLCAKSYAKGK